MHFVHVIEINDPRRPLLGGLSHEQVWRGLVHRVERPLAFLPQLSGCLIVKHGATDVARDLDFGAFTVRDSVRLEPMQQITVDTEAAPHVPAGRLVIAIEVRGTDHLQLRFTYDVNRKRSADVEMEAQYDQFVQSAYVRADIDSVKIIRNLIDRGAL
jgi:hypothetical protein